MPAEAHVTAIWKKQKLFVALFLTGVALWFFVDGEWTWPRSNVRWMEHHRLEKEKRIAEWPAYAKAQGWDPKPPEKYHDRDEIFWQFKIGSLPALAGALMLFYWLAQKRRVLRTDADSVQTPAGIRVPFSAITGLGLKKWESKGLATVRYEIDGRKGEFVLDDYKFEPEATHAIMKEIEERLLVRSS